MPRNTAKVSDYDTSCLFRSNLGSQVTFFVSHSKAKGPESLVILGIFRDVRTPRIPDICFPVSGLCVRLDCARGRWSVGGTSDLQGKSFQAR